MTDQSAARRANSILATPQDKLAVLCPDKTPAPGMADPMQIEDDDLAPVRGFIAGVAMGVIFWLVVAAGTLVWFAS